MMRLHAFSASAAIAATLALAGCSTTNPDVVSRHEAQRMATVLDAVVLTTRPVVVDGSQSGIGASAGSVVGGGEEGGAGDAGELLRARVAAAGVDVLQ